MELQFQQSQIHSLAARYEAEQNKRDRELTRRITQEVFPSYRKNGYLTKDEFLIVCAWKTPRSQSQCKSNEEEFIKEISALVLTTSSEHLRIQLWTLLVGVKWPTASVFLHFAFPNTYPILDFRAMWSLGVKEKSYTFKLWQEYTIFCRKLANKSGVTMRILDQALWKYSEINQRK